MLSLVTAPVDGGKHVQRARYVLWASAALCAFACSSGGGGETADSGADIATEMDVHVAPHHDAAQGGTHHDAGSHHIVDARADSSSDAGSGLLPGEYCVGGTPNITFDPPLVVVASGQSRPVRAIVQPDLCSPAPITFTSSNMTLVPAPSGTTLDLRQPTYSFTVQASATAPVGTATLTASMPGPDGGTGGTATLPVIVNNGALPTCASGDSASGMLGGSTTLQNGAGGTATASLSVPPGAFMRTDELAIPPFTATVACANDDLTTARATTDAGRGHSAAAGSLVAIGPAVTFTASSPIDMTESLRRELDFTIPVNPAAVPTNGRLRHAQVLFMSPGSNGVTTTPVALTIANPAITQTSSGSFVFQFSSPWFGTYQVAYSPDAGTVTRSRLVTHRAVIGFSMGAGGAATFGFRHNNQFDVIAPMGGPSDWTWLFWFIEQYNLGGFCPAVLPSGAPNPDYPGNCPTYAPNLYPFHETYAHTVDYNDWFYQAGSGNGGSFSRADYAQIFDDLALMHGNPNGQSYDPTLPDAGTALSFLPAGPTATDPWVRGQYDGGTCAVAVNPISPDPNDADPPLAVQQAWQNQCTLSRCANTWTATSGYYDAQYNPNGTYPVISYCETGLQNLADSPYEDVWSPPMAGNDYPLDVALAVDLNGNGVRDANEPILRQGHELWSDVGVDGLADVDEPGYDPVNNPDPNQDDYDFQRNPNGTEGDHRYEMGEPWLDYGIDGVQGTPQLSAGGYDYGEGDGVFTTSTGLASFYASDPHSILRQWSTDIPAGALTDTALLRLNFWADGGVRDLFNFDGVANHLMGSIASRKWAAGTTDAGTQLRSTAFYNGFSMLPGQLAGDEAAYDVNKILWADLVDAPDVRYGDIDATTAMISAGDGQHVGTPQQLLDRLQTSIYYAEQQWPDADRTLTYTNQDEIPGDASALPTDAGLGTSCQGGVCSFPFAADNRVGPVYLQLPPGYALPENIQRNVRYPVIYALHGYGQTPDGLIGTSLVSTDNMDDPTKSSATRLAKAILVYVDGRCRYSSDIPPQPECIEGSFYLNSDRPDNAHPGTNVAQFDAWFDDLITYIDQNFRTMPAVTLEVTE
jgi:hypothetical protein